MKQIKSRKAFEKRFSLIFTVSFCQNIHLVPSVSMFCRP